MVRNWNGEGCVRRQNVRDLLNLDSIYMCHLVDSMFIGNHYDDTVANILMVS